VRKRRGYAVRERQQECGRLSEGLSRFVLGFSPVNWAWVLFWDWAIDLTNLNVFLWQKPKKKQNNKTRKNWAN